MTFRLPKCQPLRKPVLRERPRSHMSRGPFTPPSALGWGLGLKIPFLFLPVSTKPLKHLPLQGDNVVTAASPYHSPAAAVPSASALQDAPRDGDGH